MYDRPGSSRAGRTGWAHRPRGRVPEPAERIGGDTVECVVVRLALETPVRGATCGEADRRTSTRSPTTIPSNTDAGPSVVSGWSRRFPYACRCVLLLGSPPMESGVPLDVGFVRDNHIGPAATETWKFPAPTDRSRVAMTAAGLS